MRHWRARTRSQSDSVRLPPPRPPGCQSERGQAPQRARRAGAAMAAVFDLDLETEEGSEGEPEFSPSVSGPPGRGSIPEPIPFPRRWNRPGLPPERLRAQPGLSSGPSRLPPTCLPGPRAYPGPPFLPSASPSQCWPIARQLPFLTPSSPGPSSPARGGGIPCLPWLLPLGFSQDVCPLAESRAAGPE